MTHVWPCRFCTFAERDLPSDFGKNNVDGWHRIVTHERDKHAVEIYNRKERRNRDA